MSSDFDAEAHRGGTGAHDRTRNRRGAGKLGTFLGVFLFPILMACKAP